MSALLVTYTGPIPGREKEALEFAVEVGEYWGKLAADGKCTLPEQFYSSATQTGYWIVKGDRDELMKVHDSPEGKGFYAKGMALLEGYTEELVMSDSEAEEFFANYGGAVASI